MAEESVRLRSLVQRIAQLDKRVIRDPAALVLAIEARVTYYGNLAEGLAWSEQLLPAARRLVWLRAEGFSLFSLEYHEALTAFERAINQVLAAGHRRPVA